jgi:hypothetical protein
MSENGQNNQSQSQRKLGVTVSRNFGPVTVSFSIESLEIVSNMAEQHAAFEKLLAQCEFEIGEYATEELMKMEADSAKKFKTPNGTIETQKAIRMERGVWKGKPVIKVFTPRYVKYGITVYPDNNLTAELDQMLGDNPMIELPGYSVQVDTAGKYPFLKALTKD